MRIAARAARTAFAAAAFVGVKNIDDKLLPTNIEIIRPKNDLSDVPISRKIVNPADHSGLNLRLYQYQSCPFCSKVRAFLDFHGFSYEVVEVNPVTKSQLKFSKDYKKVPLITSTEGTHVESSLIISELSTYLRRPDVSLTQIGEMYPMIEMADSSGKVTKCCPNKYFIMKGEAGSEAELGAEREERMWREWVDNHFVHLISPNIYRTLGESMETFEWFSKYGEWEIHFSTFSRLLAKYVGAFMMFLIAKRLKTRHNITDEKKAMVDAFDEWMDAIGPNRKFMGGDSPNLADLAMYGAMMSFYGCTAFAQMVADRPIQRWYNDMRTAVKNHEGRALIAARTKALTAKTA
ncbi:hypothetical protein Q1695_000656 [Nippostrongylus brasiliensis]|nr:hypothetical protein Q1695_000656 [Nippostrongylus brasiliensis]